MSLATRMAPRDRRALVVGALLLVPALGWRFGVQPYRRARAELGARVLEQRGLLARELALVQASDQLTDDLSTARSSLASRRSRFFSEGEPLAATATLIRMVSEDARRHDVLLDAIESRLAEPAAGGLLSIRIAVRGRSDFEGITGWLYALEQGPRLVTVEDLAIARSEGDVLFVGAVIRGFVRP